MLLVPAQDAPVGIVVAYDFGNPDLEGWRELEIEDDFFVGAIVEALDESLLVVRFLLHKIVQRPAPVSRHQFLDRILFRRGEGLLDVALVELARLDIIGGETLEKPHHARHGASWFGSDCIVTKNRKICNVCE
jgi:hypothetical protein